MGKRAEKYGFRCFATRKRIYNATLRYQAITSEAHGAILAALERVGLKLEMRDATSWGYRWFAGDLKGAHANWGMR